MLNVSPEHSFSAAKVAILLESFFSLHEKKKREYPRKVMREKSNLSIYLYVSEES